MVFREEGVAREEERGVGVGERARVRAVVAAVVAVDEGGWFKLRRRLEEGDGFGEWGMSLFGCRVGVVVVVYW